MSFAYSQPVIIFKDFIGIIHIKTHEWCFFIHAQVMSVLLLKHIYLWEWEMKKWEYFWKGYFFQTLYLYFEINNRFNHATEPIRYILQGTLVVWYDKILSHCDKNLTLPNRVPSELWSQIAVKFSVIWTYYTTSKWLNHLVLDCLVQDNH